MIDGGTLLFCKASTIFERLAAPAADSRCPKFDFAEPSSAGLSASRPRPTTRPSPSASIGSPRMVPVPCASMTSTLRGSIPASL
ncbi:Uncharacterised protein [Mycobacteroides abscessus subsp. abscessus]|nr:Uncharacterised protein [Mycobacteroides abscessus subsp. abscessus]SKU71171.1 Uncharacterised protein [Mycobacteroides abscessus subsp. abscessus]SKU75272.1 Uncharacterised protein [Mycobacteroides abscessus subsp. abscessus]